jgi:hypothetical protein
MVLQVSSETTKTMKSAIILTCVLLLSITAQAKKIDHQKSSVLVQTSNTVSSDILGSAVKSFSGNKVKSTTKILSRHKELMDLNRSDKKNSNATRLC